MIALCCSRPSCNYSLISGLILWGLYALLSGRVTHAPSRQRADTITYSPSHIQHRLFTITYSPSPIHHHLFCQSSDIHHWRERADDDERYLPSEREPPFKWPGFFVTDRGGGAGLGYSSKLIPPHACLSNAVIIITTINICTSSLSSSSSPYSSPQSPSSSL